MSKLQHVPYSALNARQRENYNAAKLAAALTDYGFACQRLTDDWQGADLIALHVDGETVLRIQLKSRLTFKREYIGKGLRLAFPDAGSWYLCPHDELLQEVLGGTSVAGTKSWKERGEYHFPRLSQQLKEQLQTYRLNPPKEGKR